MPTTVETILFKILGDSKSGERAFDRMNKRLTAFGAALTAASDAALVAFAKLGEGGAKIEALETRFGRMASAFGQSADEMLSAWDKAAAGTIDRVTLMQKANQAALLGLPVDRLADMLGIARRAAESTGQDVSYMFDSLVVGIARKSRAVLDNLGIIIDAEQAYASYAQKIGKDADALTANEQQLAFMEAAFAAAGRQAEILGENTETAAVVIQRAQARFKDAGNEVKKAFAPIVARAAALLTKLLDIFLAIPQPIKQAMATVLAIAAALGAVIGPILTIIGMWPVISGALTAIGGFISPIIGPLLAVVAVLGVLAAAVGVLVKAWKQDWGGIQTTVMGVIETIRPYLTMIVRNVQYWMHNIGMSLKLIGETIRNIVEPAFEALGLAFENNVGGIKTFLKFLNDAVSVVFSVVQKILTAINMVLSGNADKAWKPLADAALNVMTIIVLAWRKGIRKAFIWGWNLVVNLANGIIRAARTVLTQAANFIGKMLSNFLAPGSPPKEGPLHGIVKWGKGLIDTYLKSFALADFGILRDTLSPIRDALQSAVDLGDMDQKTMLKTFGEVRQQAASLIAEFRKTGQVNEDIMAGIADRLGEGGEEYTKYLRLTLEHQRALQNLSKVQEEVADAEARGFVPADLKAKLAAAQEEADKKQEAVDWQREYLAALQDGVDLQREMIEAMKELTETMKGEKGEDLLGEGAAALAGGGAEGAKVEFAGFGGFSQEFKDTKEEIRQWFAELPNKIKLWLANTGLTIITWLLEKRAQLRQSLLLIGAIVTGWLTVQLLKLRERLLMIGAIITGKLLIWRRNIILWFSQLALRILVWFLEQRTKLEQSLLMIGAIILGKLLIWRQNIITWFQERRNDIVTGLAHIRATIGLWFTKQKILIRQKIEEWKNVLRIKWIEIKIWFGNKIEEFKTTLTNVIDDVKGIGRDIIGGLWGGLKEKWEDVKTWWQNKMAWLHSSAEEENEIQSPSKVFYRIGQMVGEGYIRGVNDKLAGVAQRTFGGVAAQGLAGAGGLRAEQIVVALPNVTDGFNANGIVDYLQSLADQANLRGSVPGGIMD
jgi:hypothetical protein